MADRSILHRSKLEEFETWLKVNGYRVLPTKHSATSYEILRWKGAPGKPMPMLFDRNNGDHLSANDASVPYIRKFLKDKRKKPYP